MLSAADDYLNTMMLLQGLADTAITDAQSQIYAAVGRYQTTMQSANIDYGNRTCTGQAARALHAIRKMALNLARRLDQSTPNLCRENALKPNLLMNRLRIFKN